MNTSPGKPVVSNIPNCGCRALQQAQFISLLHRGLFQSVCPLKTLSASSGFSVALYFNSNPRCSPDPGPTQRHIRPPSWNPTKVTTSLQPLVSSPLHEERVALPCREADVKLWYEFPKGNHACSQRQNHSLYIYAVLNICSLMESGLTHLTQNIAHFLRVSLFSLSLSLSPFSGYAGHLASLSSCLWRLCAKAVPFCARCSVLCGSARPPHPSAPSMSSLFWGWLSLFSQSSAAACDVSFARTHVKLPRATRILQSDLSLIFSAYLISFFRAFFFLLLSCVCARVFVRLSVWSLMQNRGTAGDLRLVYTYTHTHASFACSSSSIRSGSAKALSSTGCSAVIGCQHILCYKHHCWKLGDTHGHTWTQDTHRTRLYCVSIKCGW